jgi:pimeloyl-ACP methyl ester carboxylesterase
MPEIGFEHHSADVNDVRLHYVRAGQGEPVVLLHGWPETWYQWRKIIPALAEHYTVIAPDMRGLGDSSKPRDGYDKRTVASDIYALVQQLGFENIFLVGHDWGGPVAYAYAAGYREAVRRLVILDAPIVKSPEELEQLQVLFWHLSFHTLPDLPEMLVAGRERAYLSWFYRNGYNPSAISEEAIDEYVRCYAAPGGMRAGFEYYRAFPADAQHNAESAKTKLEIPVLALGGQQSLGMMAVEAMKSLAVNVRGGEIERCGHWIAEEQPSILTEQLLHFFGEESGPDDPSTQGETREAI